MNIMTTRTVANFAVRLLTGRVVLIALTEITVMGRAVIGVCGAALLRMALAAPTAPRVTTRSNFGLLYATALPSCHARPVSSTG
jgi:hypothetical protein